MIKNIMNKTISNISILLASLIIIISYLLPLDKGVPAVITLPTMSVYPIFILILLLFGIIFLKEKLYLKIPEMLKNPYIQNQLIIIAVFLISIRNEYMHKAIGFTVQYICIFLINFINFHYLLKEKRAKKIIISVAITSALAAALIGIYEFITKTYPQPYKYFISITNGPNDFIDDASSKYLMAKGTQGLHIIYSFLMAISVCLCEFIKSKWHKTLFFIIMCIGCIVGISTTGFAILSVLCFGMLYIFMSKIDFKRIKKHTLTLIIIALLTTIIIITAVFIEIPSIGDITKRIIAGGSESTQMRANRTNWVIYNMKNFATNDMPKFLFGNGLKTSSPNYTKDFPPPPWWPVGTGLVYSLDNEYLSLAYETGIIGLLLFCFSWLKLLLNKSYKIKSMVWWLILSYMVGLFGLDFLPYSGINAIFVFLIAALLGNGNEKELTPEK